MGSEHLLKPVRQLIQSVNNTLVAALLDAGLDHTAVAERLGILRETLEEIDGRRPRWCP